MRWRLPDICNPGFSLNDGACSPQRSSAPNQLWWRWQMDRGVMALPCASGGGHRGSLWTSCYCLATQIDGLTSYQKHSLDTAPNLSWSDGIWRTGRTI
jgi:hypothetical protein